MSHTHTLNPEQVAQEIIEQSKHIIAEELERGLRVTQKPDNTPVTQIDMRINEFAIEFIGRHFSGDAIYAEEGNGGAGVTGYTWVIDPIDGTRALELGMPTYTVCIARVAPDGQPDFSFVYNPSTGDLYHFKRGEKATKNGVYLKVLKKKELKNAQVYINSRLPIGAIQAGELGHRLEKAGAGRVTTHSLAYGVLLVAEGKLAAAIAGTPEPYELAAVKPIIEGAGGVVSDLEGMSIKRCDGKLRGFIAAASREILEEILLLYHAKLQTTTTSIVDPWTIIRQYAPEARDIQPVKSGYVNDVYIVDEMHVFRFPKNDTSKKILLFEVEVLRRLEGNTRLAIPRVQHVQPDGSWAQFSYIHGAHYDSRTICGMSEERKRDFASDIAKFLFDMNRVIPREWIKEKIEALPVDRKDDAKYYGELLELGRENNNHYVDLYETYYSRLMNLHENVFSSEEIVIHGDLHSGNFIFGKDDRLSGIFDFGDCMLHTVYFELRQLCPFGDDIVQMAIDALGGRFGQISKEAVRTLAIAHELSILMRLGSKEETPYDKDRSEIAKGLLRSWAVIE